MATAETLTFPMIAAPTGLHLDAYLSGSDDDRLRDLLAFSLATAAGDAANAATIAGRRAEAERTLADHAFRLVHNQVAVIKAEAVSEYRGRQPKPLGFMGSVAANLVALACVCGLGWLAYDWLAARGIG